MTINLQMSEKEDVTNDFEKIINELGVLVEESDLEKILKVKIDIHSRRYVWVLGSLIPLALFFANLNFPEFKSSFFSMIFIFAVLVLYILFIFVTQYIVKWDPFKQQEPIFVNYIKARNRLKILKKKNKSDK